MGKSIVEIVVDTLTSAGIRTQRAFPGGRTPDIESLVAAVHLKQMDQARGTAITEITVMVPAVLGAAQCEDKGVWICRLLKSVGGCCLQGQAEYVPNADIFCVRIAAEFIGRETINGWEEPKLPPSFSVRLGTTILNHAVSFETWQEISEGAAALGSAHWHFRLEETVPLDGKEDATPEAPFSVTVIRIGQMETYTQCEIISRRREIRADGLHQIREGKAVGRTVTELE